MAYSTHNGSGKGKGAGKATATATKTGKKSVSVPQPRTEAEIATAQRLLEMVKQLPDVRRELVTGARRQIADGTYETPEKIDRAIESLVKDLPVDGPEIKGKFIGH